MRASQWIDRPSRRSALKNVISHLEFVVVVAARRGGRFRTSVIAPRSGLFGSAAPPVRDGGSACGLRSGRAYLDATRALDLPNVLTAVFLDDRIVFDEA